MSEDSVRKGLIKAGQETKVRYRHQNNTFDVDARDKAKQCSFLG